MVPGGKALRRQRVGGDVAAVLMQVLVEMYSNQDAVKNIAAPAAVFDNEDW